MSLAAGLLPMTPAPAQTSSTPTYDHVFVIVMENHAYGEIVGSSAAPYTNSLLSSGALATSYTGVAHPSLPNYLGLTGGSTFGITTDCTTCWISATNIADSVEAAGGTWKAYMESMPSACYVGDSYPYAQKHNPFVYYNDIRNSPSRCAAHDVPYTQLANDLKSTSTTPNYGFITPNMCNDMHDCTVATGDAWMQSQVPAILGSPAFTTQRSLLVLTWDEDDFTTSNQVATIFLGSVAAGMRSGTAYNHYSLLRTVEALRGLGPLTTTTGDANASLMSDMLGGASSKCTSVGLSASPVSPSGQGTPVTFSANASGCPNPLYQFWVRPPGSSTTWQIVQPYSPSSSYTWTTSGLVAGTYWYTVWARDASSPGAQCSSLGCDDAYFPAPTYNLTSPTCTSVMDTASPASAELSGTSITFNATSTGCPNPLYQFWVLRPGSTTWQVLQAYSASSSSVWNTTGMLPGNYLYTAWVRNAGSPGSHCSYLGCDDAYMAAATYTLTRLPCTSVVDTAIPGSPQRSGTSVTFTATSTGCPHPLYQFWVLKPGSTTWQVLQAYSTNNTYVWSTVGLPAGSYLYTAWARDASSAGTQCSYLGCDDAFMSALGFGLSS